MKISTLQDDYIFAESDPLFPIGVRQCLRYVSGEISYLSMMEINPNGVDPGAFLKFAKLDILEDNDKGAINAIGNAKRAVHLLIDSLLELLGLSSAYKKARFPEKLLLIQKLEAFPTKLIDNLNRDRNNVEHSYRKMSVQKAEEYVEITEMFYLLCLPFLKHLINSVHIGRVGDEKDVMWLLNPFTSVVSIHECKKSSSIDQASGRVFYNFSNDKADLPVIQLFEIRKKNINDWLPILNTLIYITRKATVPKNPPYDPKHYNRIMWFSTSGRYFDEDSQGVS